MAEDKSASITHSTNGPTATEASRAAEQASQNELERLRDILVGSHVRRSEQRVAELQAQLDVTQHALEGRLDELAADLESRLQERQNAAQRQEAALRHELQELRTLLEGEKALRANVGQLLVKVGRLLQQEELPSGK